MKIKEQSGSYSLEALVSLTAFVLVIMGTYAMLKSMIGEAIMQQAVNNVSQQVSAYVYILDRTGLIISHNDPDVGGVNTAIGAGAGAAGQVSEQLRNAKAEAAAGNLDQAAELIGGLFSGGEDNAFGKFIEAAKAVKWKEAGVEAGRYALDGAIKSGSNLLLNQMYDMLLDKYLPMERSAFCRTFNIREETIRFNESRIFPTDKNNSVFVAVTFVSYPQYRIGNLTDRRVVKCSYSAAWVSSNTHKIK